MDERTREPVKITAEDINPRYNWGRASAGARHHGRRFRGARRLPPPAPLSPRPRAGRRWRTSDLGALLRVRRQQHPLRHLDQDRRMGARQAVALGAAARATASRSCGISARPPCITSSIRHGSSPENCKAGLVGLRGTVDPAFGLMKRHAEEMASILDPRSRRRQDADRRRHHRAADDVRAGEGRAQDQGRPAGHAGSARDQVGRRDRAAQPRRRDGRWRLSPDQRECSSRACARTTSSPR